jgi:hypothetical protein
MTQPEDAAKASTGEAPDQAPEPAPVPPSRRGRVLPWLCAGGFAVLAGVLAWLWLHPAPPPPPAEAADLTPLLARLDTLENRVARLETASRGAPSGTTSGGTAPADLAPLDARIAALENRPAATAQPDPALAGQIAALAAREERSIRIQAAWTALEAGHRLGKLPGAPAALERFADTDPPTEAALRLAFPSAARAAMVASRPVDTDQPVLSRLWARAQELITIRQGERVIVGDPAAGVIAVARQALEAGDLAGAVNALGRLQGPAATAMAGWLGDARALLEARAALAALAAAG